MRRSFVYPACIALGIALAGIGTAALGARGSSGTYSLPSGNPVVSGTVISTTWANNTLSDISTELTDSLSRSGKGGMLAPMRTTDGTVSAPSISFTNETGTGLYRYGAGDARMCVLGTARQTWTNTGASVTGTFGVSGATTLSSTLGVTGNATVGGTLGVTGAATFSGGITGQIARTNLPTVGQQVSSSCGSFSVTSATMADVTNLSVTLSSATGRPIMVALIPSGTTGSGVTIESGEQLDLAYVINTSEVARFVAHNWNAAELHLLPSAVYLATGLSGSVTIKVQAKRLGTGSVVVKYYSLMAYEL